LEVKIMTSKSVGS